MDRYIYGYVEKRKQNFNDESNILIVQGVTIWALFKSKIFLENFEG